MEQSYWLGRNHMSMRMAHQASSSEARLIHYALAGSYSVKAAEAAWLQLHLPKPDLRSFAVREPDSAAGPIRHASDGPGRD